MSRPAVCAWCTAETDTPAEALWLELTDWRTFGSEWWCSAEHFIRDQERRVNAWLCGQVVEVAA